MTILRIARGSQRTAVIVGPIAIKFARARRLREGARANREESRIWQEGWQRFYPELCPVYFCAPFGVALVMPAARIMTRDEFETLAHPDHAPDPDLYEDKLGEWGIVGGRPVVVDYAKRVHMTASELETINKRVRTIADVERWRADD